VHSAAPGLTEKFVAEDFDFNGKTLTGAKEIQPRWKRCVQATDRSLGEGLGQVYVQKTFSSGSQGPRQGNGAQPDCRSSRRFADSSMDGAGHARASNSETSGFWREKSATTDKWRDYSALKIERQSYAENQMRSAEFDVARVLEKIGKPVDRTEWGMTPPTVNAYNSSSMNEIVFPRGHHAATLLRSQGR